MNSEVKDNYFFFVEFETNLLNFATCTRMMSTVLHYNRTLVLNTIIHSLVGLALALDAANQVLFLEIEYVARLS